MRIGVLGGTGPAGQAVALRLAATGLEVTVGSRSQERADEIVSTLFERWPGRGLPLSAGVNAAAARADVVVIATPWEGVPATLAGLRKELAGRIVVSMVNALTRWGDRLVPLVPPTGSVTAAVAMAIPEARVTGAFHHLPAGPLGDLDRIVEADVLVCGDDRDAVAEVNRLIDRVPGLRGVDAGGLGSALAIEALTPALLEVNRRYKVHASLRLSGLDGVQH